MLRDYQQEAVDTLFDYWGDKEFSHPCILQLSTGCLAKGTPVLMVNNSLKNVEEIESGDSVWSFDDYGAPHKNIVSKVIRTSTKPKPMLELEYGGEKITTTYDHPFFNGEGYYPLYQLVWGAMEESARAQLKLLCEQYGTPFNDKAVWCKHSGNNEACLGRMWLLQDADGWEDSQAPQNSSKGLAGEPYQLALCQPYQWRQDGQSSREPRVVFCKIQRMVGGEDRGNQSSSKQEQREGRQFRQGVHQTILPGQHGISASLAEVCPLRYSPAEVPPSGESDSLQIRKGQVRVKVSEPYYTISLCKAPYTYCIGRGGFLTHNSGKSHIISEIVKRLNQPVLVLQPTKEILEQNYEKLELAGVPREYISVCSASAGGWEIGAITLATIGTIGKHYDKCKHFKAIVIDECLDSGHEVLTPTGWMSIRTACEQGVKIAQWEEGKIDFVLPSRWVRKQTSTPKVKMTVRGEGIRQGVELIMTQNHRQLVEYRDYHGVVDDRVFSAKDIPLGNTWLKVSSSVTKVDERATPLDRLKIAIAADGYVEERGGGLYWNRLSFRRKRKIERAKSLLVECGLEYKESVNARGDTQLCFHTSFPKGFTEIDLSSLSGSQARDLCEESLYWDGCKKQMNFDTPNEREAAFMQALAALGGYQTSLQVITQKKQSPSYRVHFIDRHTKKLSSHNSCRGNGTSKELVDYDGEMFCPTVPSSFFMVRKKGFVYVTGNCDVVNNNDAYGQYLSFFNHLRESGVAPRIVGLTATPWRNQNFLDGLGNPSVFCRPLTRIFTRGGKGTPHTEWFWKGGVIYKCEIPFLQERGFLAPTKYYEAETDWSFVQNLPGRVDFDTNEMTKWLDFDSNMSRFHQAVKWCMDNNLKTIVFTPNIDMNFRLAECIAAGGGTAKTMDSNNDTRSSRKQKMDDFRAGKYQFLVNVGMVGRGVDVPSVDAVILARPTKSLSLYMQYVGRCLRPDPTNPDKIARILDLSGNVARFGKVEGVRLIKEKAKSKTGWAFDKDIISVNIGGKDYKWEKVS